MYTKLVCEHHGLRCDMSASNTTRLGSANVCLMASGSLKRAKNTSTAIFGGRHSENFKFSMASGFGIGCDGVGRKAI